MAFGRKEAHLPIPFPPEDMWEDQGHAFQMEVLWAPEYSFTLIILLSTSLVQVTNFDNFLK